MHYCIFIVLLLVEEILHKLIGSLSRYTRFFTSQPVEDFFHQQFVVNGISRKTVITQNSCRKTMVHIEFYKTRSWGSISDGEFLRRGFLRPEVGVKKFGTVVRMINLV